MENKENERMNKECGECGTTHIITTCDHCSVNTCRDCCYLRIENNTLVLTHRACVPKKHWKKRGVEGDE